jgi:hypothetical protein
MEGDLVVVIKSICLIITSVYLFFGCFEFFPFILKKKWMKKNPLYVLLDGKPKVLKPWFNSFIY